MTNKIYEYKVMRCGTGAADIEQCLDLDSSDLMGVDAVIHWRLHSIVPDTFKTAKDDCSPTDREELDGYLDGGLTLIFERELD